MKLATNPRKNSDVTTKVTLRHVADHAQVSVASASLALNNKQGVSEETRARVLEIAAELGYQQTIRVAVSSPNNLKQIACLVRHNISDEDVGYDNIYNQVLAGAEQGTKRDEIEIVIYPLEVNDQSVVVDWSGVPKSEQFDGYAIIGCHSHYAELDKIIDTTMPIVLVDSFIDNAQFDQVLPDNFGGGYAATQYLIKQGHINIGVIGYQDGCFPGIEERYRGFKQALIDHGIESHLMEASPLHMKTAHKAAHKMLLNSPVTGIFALNDPAAFGVYQAAHDLGLRIPDELSVIGFDDLKMANIISPPLTTIHIDKLLTGTVALEHLQNRVAQAHRTTVTSYIHTRLVIRGSVAKPREALFNS